MLETTILTWTKIMILAQVFGFDADLIENLILEQPGLEKRLQGLRAVVAKLFGKRDGY
jgi:hypothetical protein